MIYEADKGETLQMAAIEAVKAGCDRVLFNDCLYDVEVTTERIGKFVPDTAEAAPCKSN